MSLPELIVVSNRQKVARIAQDIIDGRVGIIDGSRQIDALRGKHVGLDEFDPDFVTFLGIDSETDSLPIGESRKHWAPDALAKKDEEIAAAEKFYRKRALESASRLVARFANEKPPASAYDHYTPNT